ncbi:MAG: hypothetical protein HW390_3281 [Candidatus Brocadiaceae bacterium]|nr:hypothetical protein [Candidatus Brocadiaceae bacterium]
MSLSMFLSRERNIKNRTGERYEGIFANLNPQTLFFASFEHLRYYSRKKNTAKNAKEEDIDERLHFV